MVENLAGQMRLPEFFSSAVPSGDLPAFLRSDLPSTFRAAARSPSFHCCTFFQKAALLSRINRPVSNVQTQVAWLLPADLAQRKRKKGKTL